MAKKAKQESEKTFEQTFRETFNVAPNISSEEALQQVVNALLSEPMWITIVWTLGGPSIRTSIDANDAEQVYRLATALVRTAQELQELAFRLKNAPQPTNKE